MKHAASDWMKHVAFDWLKHAVRCKQLGSKRHQHGKWLIVVQYHTEMCILKLINVPTSVLRFCPKQVDVDREKSIDG